MTQLDPKALEAAVAAFRKSTFDALTLEECGDAARDAITAYLSALPPPAEAGELEFRVERWAALEANYIAEVQSLSLRLETVTRERDSAAPFERAVRDILTFHPEPTGVDNFEQIAKHARATVMEAMHQRTALKEPS